MTEEFDLNAPPLPPLSAAVKGCTRIAVFSDNTSDELWKADVRLWRSGTLDRVFPDVVFVESAGTAFVLGLENEEGTVERGSDLFGEAQEEFVAFIRAQTRTELEQMGPLAPLFPTLPYNTEGKVTAAYVIARGNNFNLGIGYRDEDGTYRHIGLPLESSGFMESALATLPFDDLGK